MLEVAERALLDERRPITREEADAVAALPLEDLPALIALAHRVRLAYCGAEVELESERGGRFQRLRERLSASRKALADELTASVLDRLDDADWERLEEALILADVGARTTADDVVQTITAQTSLATAATAFTGDGMLQGRTSFTKPLQVALFTWTGQADVTVIGTAQLTTGVTGRLGLACRITDDNNYWRIGISTANGFEIEGVSAKLMERFSKRSQQRDLAVKRQEQKLGRKLKNREVVHHINRVKTDNRRKNVWVFKSQKKHDSAHRRDKKRFGRW